MPFPVDRSEPQTPSIRRDLFHPILAVGAVLLAAACGGGADLLLLPGDGEPASIRVENDHQSGRVGEPLADSLSFMVSDSRTRAVEGARIVFDLGSAPGADVVPDTAETDANGRAWVQMVLGTTIGAQTGVARVVMPEGAVAPTTSFTVTALPENANGILALSGDGQSAPAGSGLPQPLVVQVTDAFGNPIAGVPITWTAEGGGSVSEASNLTDGGGQASVQRTLGPTAGTQTTLATSEGLAGSPVIFTHIALAGSAAGLSIVSGNEQTAQVGTELPGDLVVRLVDAAGNGVPNAAVTWVVGTGGGRVSPENTVTDEAGRTSSRWTLGPTPGENRVDAVVSGVGVVHFTATGTAARPAGLAILTQPASSSRNGEALSRQPVIQVRDGAGNPVAGVLVTAQLSGGGGELLGTRQLSSDASGRVAYTDLAIAGAEGPRRLVFTAPAFAGVTSATIVVRAIPTTTRITSDSPDPSVAGGAVTVTVQVTAERVVPIGPVTVTGDGQSCTATLVGGTGSCQLTLSTVGTRTLRATYSGSAGLTGSSATEDHTVDAAPTPNNPPHADYNWHCEGLSCAFTDASTDSDGSVIRWNWNFGDGGTSEQREPTHVYGVPGTYVVTLTVTDDDGASNTASAHVQVDAPNPPPPGNQPPVAAFTSNCNQLTCSFNSDGSGDSDGQIRSYSWNFGDGGSSDQRNPSHTYGSANTYNVTLAVTDDDGATSSVTHQVTTTAPPPPENKAPHADFDVHCQFMTCTFEDKSRDDDGTIVSRSWNYGDGSAPSDVPSHTYSTPGKYKVTLTVTDDRGATDTRDHDAEAKAPPPASTITQITSDSPDPSDPGQAFTVSFSVTSGSGVPTGSVTVGDGVQSCTGDLSGGIGSCQLQLTTSGQRTLQASYSGAPGFERSGDTETHFVTSPPASTTTEITRDDPDPSIVGQPVTVEFRVRSDAGTPGGQVSINAGPDSCSGTLDGNGEGSCNLTMTVSGATTINAQYAGNSSFGPSSDDESHQVDESAGTSTSIIGVNPEPSEPGDAITVSFSVTSGLGTPTGTVQVTDQNGLGCTGTAPSDSCAYTPNGSGGDLTITANYLGSGSFQPSSDTYHHTVTEANTAPVAVIGSIICNGMHCAYTDDSTDANGADTIASYAWGFGDGASSDLRNPSHDYANAGGYTVTLTVTDDHNASDDDSQTISVTDSGDGSGGTGSLIAKAPPS